VAFESVSCTHVGLRRQMNEDSVLARPECGLWAVADGMGGHEAGEVASGKVREALSSLFPANGLDGLVEDAVAALQMVNRDLIALAASKGSDRSIGTTVVGLAIVNGQYRCFWAGDSRAYRVRGQEIVQLTRDHSLVQSLVDAGMLEPEQAINHPDASVITRAVGAAEELKVDTVTGDVLPGDRFLLASDGLTRVVADEELAAELSVNSPQEAADKLLETVLARGAPDNVSMVIVRAI
jgi:serine/threonine protein phosphatase PrpC